MKKICIIFLALLALPVFAASADLERGGVSFDFEASVPGANCTQSQVALVGKKTRLPMPVT